MHVEYKNRPTISVSQCRHRLRPGSFAWFEWFPAAACTISNLNVSPGDVMYGLICVYTSTEAAVYLGNMTTGELRVVRERRVI